MASLPFRLQDAFHGIARQYHKNPLVKCSAGTKPFSIIGRTPKLVSERTPLKPSTSKLSTYKILGPDIILLENYVSLKDQADIVNICQKWGIGPGGFYKSTELQLHMMCLGRNWDPITGYENHCRSDGSEPPPLPHELISLAEAAVQDAQAHLNELPSMRPDICLVKFYSSFDRLDLHQDCDESSDSLERGLPVVSISIGEMAEFVYGNTRDKKKLKSVLLESGDVLIFGGKSRLMYHGVPQIAEYTTPKPLLRETELIAGRLSLTFRQI